MSISITAQSHLHQHPGVWLGAKLVLALVAVLLLSLTAAGLETRYGVAPSADSATSWVLFGEWIGGLFLCASSKQICRLKLEAAMKRFGFVCTLAIFGFAAFLWLIPGTSPASDQTTASQVNIQELMQNAHGLPDTTVVEPFWMRSSSICGSPTFLMEELMERMLFQEIATPADLHQHHKWARRVGAFYGILFLGAISFVVVHHHYQPTNDVKASVTSVAAINHLQRWDYPGVSSQISTSPK
jgi:hypothetical protein